MTKIKELLGGRRVGVQNFAHNISIPMHNDKNKGVGGWAESWWIV
jgi:hypothetical protein